MSSWTNFFSRKDFFIKFFFKMCIFLHIFIWQNQNFRYLIRNSRKYQFFMFLVNFYKIIIYRPYFAPQPVMRKSSTYRYIQIWKPHQKMKKMTCLTDLFGPNGQILPELPLTSTRKCNYCTIHKSTIFTLKSQTQHNNTINCVQLYHNNVQLVKLITPFSVE